MQPLREACGPERLFLRALLDEDLENKGTVVIPFLPENWSARSHRSLLAEVGFEFFF